MNIAPDTAQNIRVMIDLIFLHNFLAIMYALGILVSLAISIYKPSRALVLMLVGFITLLFAFEYTKHIMEPLIAQTTGSLITERQSPTIERLIHVVLRRLLPLGLPIVGWLFVGLGVLGGALNLKKEKKEVKIIEVNQKIKYTISPHQRKLLNQMVESLYQFKKGDTTLARLLGNLEATLKAGDFDKSINFSEWYKVVGRLEKHSTEHGENVTYKDIQTDIKEMEAFLTDILQHAK